MGLHRKAWSKVLGVLAGSRDGPSHHRAAWAEPQYIPVNWAWGAPSLSFWKAIMCAHTHHA